ncbi:hypothetical protein OG723_44465 (plasmid) [Streptomyces sp. NBC_01278]|uniref:hypothetical protein n=1 Tax=Streptomyces sp. NBC_01278 TaxID=2903809 RepID=UPI002E30214D|nr:hypothetical protein [Streptomyces sp. NBC_01278]
MIISAAFHPVIISPGMRTAPDSVDGALVRTTTAAELVDGDLVVGCAQEPTYASMKRVTTGEDPDGKTAIVVGEFFRKPYVVKGHATQAGWVSFAKDCFVWRPDSRILYVPAAFL